MKHLVVRVSASQKEPLSCNTQSESQCSLGPLKGRFRSEHQKQKGGQAAILPKGVAGVRSGPSCLGDLRSCSFREPSLRASQSWAPTEEVGNLEET